MREKAIRCLIVSGDAETIQLLEEAFLEIDQTRFSRDWMQPCERVYSLDASQAARYDVVLLDTAADAEVGAIPAPVIVLTSEQDEAVAIRMVRQGAQSYLLRSELDCLPLARQLRRALERHRLQAARQSLSLVDPVTSLYNDRGFFHLGERQSRLAARFSLYVEVTLVQCVSEAVEETAQRLRALTEESDVLAHLGRGRFGIVALHASAGEAGRRLPQACEGLRLATTGAYAHPGGPDVPQLVGEAENLLCENGLVASCP